MKTFFRTSAVVTLLTLIVGMSAMPLYVEKAKAAACVPSMLNNFKCPNPPPKDDDGDETPPKKTGAKPAPQTPEQKAAATAAAAKKAEDDAKYQASKAAQKVIEDTMSGLEFTPECLKPEEKLRATITEEVIDGSQKPGDTVDTTQKEYVKTCYRKTVCLTFNDPNGGDSTKDFCRSELTTECKSGAAGTPGETGYERNTCQQVQAFIGSGLGLVALYVGFIYRWAATIVGIIAVLVITFSGIQISTASGDSSTIESAKKRIFESLLAVAILFLSALILNVINPNFFT